MIFRMMIVLSFIILQGRLLPQVIDTFIDGEFASNPAWIGSTGSWQIVADSDCAAGSAGSNTLRLDVETGSGVVYLGTDNPFPWGVEQTWGFWIGKRAQAATASNHSIVWLWASEIDFLSGTIDGYRVKFGDNGGDDEIVLQRVDNGTVTDILTSSGAVPNGLTDYGFLVRVTRTNSSEWTLFTSPLPAANGNGAIASDVPSDTNTPVNQGGTVDNTYSNFNGGYIGFAAVHSSSANARSSAEFDQLYFAQSSDASLPVQLYSFTALQTDQGICLKWTTQSEVNNLGFHVFKKSAQHDSFFLASPLLRGAGTSSSLNHYEYLDRRFNTGKIDYKLKQLDAGGSFQFFGPVSVTVKKKKNLNNQLEDFHLECYPNPFNTTTYLDVVNPNDSEMALNVTIYNVIGVAIRTLKNLRIKSGHNQIVWDGRDDKNVLVPSGVYFYCVQTDAGKMTAKKMLKID